MAGTVGSRRSLIVSLALTIVISIGALVTTLSFGWGPKLGLDLAGGLSVVYKPATATSTANMQEVVNILNNRVNGLGVSGAQVNLQGKDVVVSVPGVKDARAVLKAVGQTAQLLFRPVLCEASAPTKKARVVSTIPSCGSNYLMTAANLAVNTSTGLPTNNIGLDKVDRRILGLLCRQFRGQPVGLVTLSHASGEETATIEDAYEPYLLRAGLLTRTPRGRLATDLAYAHLGLRPPGGGLV